GLQTVSWLFDGEIEHRDSGGHHLFVRPGELNLMTGGRGIAHSEVSTDKTETLHGVQPWVALPDEARDAPRDLQFYRPGPVRLGGAVAKVFLGSLAGTASPVRTYTPLLGAELVLDPGAGVELSLDETFEHGILLDQGELAVTGVPVNPAELAYLAPGHTTVELRAGAGEPARILLLGGPPFGEEIVMWWNFVGRSHDEIVEFRAAWEAGADRFGEVDGYVGTPHRLPAPALPNAVTKPRRNPGCRRIARRAPGATPAGVPSRAARPARSRPASCCLTPQEHPGNFYEQKCSSMLPSGNGQSTDSSGHPPRDGAGEHGDHRRAGRRGGHRSADLVHHVGPPPAHVPPVVAVRGHAHARRHAAAPGHRAGHPACRAPV